MAVISSTSSPAQRERKGARFAKQNGIGEGNSFTALALTSPLRRNGSPPLPQTGEDA